jgi:hypothetical protein
VERVYAQAEDRQEYTPAYVERRYAILHGVGDEPASIAVYNESVHEVAAMITRWQSGVRPTAPERRYLDRALREVDSWIGADWHIELEAMCVYPLAAARSYAGQ